VVSVTMYRYRVEGSVIVQQFSAIWRGMGGVEVLTHVWNVVASGRAVRFKPGCHLHRRGNGDMGILVG
jgi:hypothetical protein